MFCKKCVVLYEFEEKIVPYLVLKWILQWLVLIFRIKKQPFESPEKAEGREKGSCYKHSGSSFKNRKRTKSKKIHGIHERTGEEHD